MAEQQSKKKTSKKEKPLNKAYVMRVEHPVRVLSRIIQSSGYAEAKSYAEHYKIVPALDKLSNRSWVQKRMGGHTEMHLRVGRALRRNALRAQRANGKAYLENPVIREETYAQALAMDEQFEIGAVLRRGSQVGWAILDEFSRKATRKASVKRSVKTKAKAKVTKRRE